MRYYFRLQFKLLNRHLNDFGIQPLLGYFLLIILFTGLSVLLFLKTELAEYIYAAVAVGFIFRLSETGRNRFLKTCFNAYDYYQIRILENLIVVLPFAIFLAYESSFLTSILLIPVAIMLVFFNFSQALNITIPTPFSKRPFEFTAGFRNTFYMILFAYFLAIMAVTSGNFNLGIFALILVFILCISYYQNPENEYFVWIFSRSPQGFLTHKIRVALLFSSLLCLPVAAILSVFFSENIVAIAGFLFLGYLYLIAVILAKYSIFPDKINLPQILVIAFSVSFPPLLLGLIPFFYIKSVNRLKEILE